MHNITKEHIKLIEEFLEKFGSHRKAEIIYELLMKIKGSPAGTPRNSIIQKFAKEKNLTEAVVHKWFNAYMNFGLGKLVDYKLLAQQYLLDNPFCIKDGKIMNWSKRSLSKQFEKQMLKDGYKITIGIKETTARDIINYVVINQDTLLRESGQLHVIALDYIEEPRKKLMKTLKHMKSYRVVYHGADINVTTRVIEVIEKVDMEQNSNHIAQSLKKENIAYLAIELLKTIAYIRRKYKWKGKLIVYMPEADVSKELCKLLEDIAIRSIEVNPKHMKIRQDEIEFSFERIEKYKESKYR